MAKSEAAYLRNTQTLSQLSLALGKFASGVQEAMIQTDAEIRHSQEWLQERGNYWHRQVVQAQQEVQAAQYALHRCQIILTLLNSGWVANSALSLQATAR